MVTLTIKQAISDGRDLFKNLNRINKAVETIKANGNSQKPNGKALEKEDEPCRT